MNKDTLNGILKYNRVAEKEIARLREENIKLQDKIHKAIDYIKNKARNNCWIDQYESCELIDILRGEDNE
jgi:hypothetical protein